MAQTDKRPCGLKLVTKMTSFNSLLENTASQAPADSRETAASWVWNSVISPANIRLLFFSPSLLVGNNYRSVSGLVWAVSY